MDFYLNSINNDVDKFQANVSINVANTYRNTPFYINHNIDWRGRIYTQSIPLSYQGSDLSISLLCFAEAYKLNNSGLKYLKIYGANTHNDNNISIK